MSLQNTVDVVGNMFSGLIGLVVMNELENSLGCAYLVNIIGIRYHIHLSNRSFHFRGSQRCETNMFHRNHSKSTTLSRLIA